MPGKEMKTVANCEGWRQPTRLFSGWALVQKFSSLCLVHTGFLVLKEAVADWSSVLHPWVTGLIVMWPISFGLFRLILQPFPLHAVWPFIPSSKKNRAGSWRVWHPKGEALPVILLVSLSAGYRIDFEGQIMAQGRVKTQRLLTFQSPPPGVFHFLLVHTEMAAAQTPINALLCRLAGCLSLMLLCPRLLP